MFGLTELVIAPARPSQQFVLAVLLEPRLTVTVGVLAYKAASDIYADLSKTNPMFKRMYDSLVPFRSDSYLWTQVAEMGFDNFMVRMRTRS